MYELRAKRSPRHSYAAQLYRDLISSSTRSTVARHFHNFLLIAWRKRTALIGGELALHFTPFSSSLGTGIGSGSVISTTAPSLLCVVARTQ